VITRFFGCFPYRTLEESFVALLSGDEAVRAQAVFDLNSRLGYWRDAANGFRSVRMDALKAEIVDLHVQLLDDMTRMPVGEAIRPLARNLLTLYQGLHAELDRGYRAEADELKRRRGFK
jgi:hypothetical protein